MYTEVMLAANTSVSTWIAIATLVLMMIPVYIASLKGAQSYGRLEQKVDTLASAVAETSRQNAATASLLTATLVKLTDQFQQHSLQDASNFGEIRGLVGGTPAKHTPV